MTPAPVLLAGQAGVLLPSPLLADDATAPPAAVAGSVAIAVASGAASMSNLRGGICRWHAEGRPIEGGSTVHHFDTSWGALLRRTLGQG